MINRFNLFSSETTRMQISSLKLGDFLKKICQFFWEK